MSNKLEIQIMVIIKKEQNTEKLKSKYPANIYFIYSENPEPEFPLLVLIYT